MYVENNQCKYCIEKSPACSISLFFLHTCQSFITMTLQAGIGTLKQNIWEIGFVCLLFKERILFYLSRNRNLSCKNLSLSLHRVNTSFSKDDRFSYLV